MAVPARRKRCPIHQDRWTASEADRHRLGIRQGAVRTIRTTPRCRVIVTGAEAPAETYLMNWATIPSSVVNSAQMAMMLVMMMSHVRI